MEKLKFKVIGLGEWSVVNSNPETKYHQIEGVESSGSVVKLWLPMEIVDTIINREAQVKRKDSYRKTADYFKNERNELQRRNAEMAEAVSELRKKNIELEESVGILGFMSDDMSEEIEMKFHRHRVTTTILGFLATIEAIAIVAFILLMQK